MKRSFVLRCAALTALMLPAVAQAAGEATPEPGLWRGPWYLGMTSGVAELRLELDSGTLSLTNNENFGEGETQIAGVEREPGMLRFRATGEDGKSLVCQIPVTPDGGKARGFCRYGGFNLRFELTRIAVSSGSR